MALITRLSRLFQADLHAVLDRIEEPDALLRQAIREMEDSLADDAHQSKLLKQQQAQLISRQTELERSLGEIENKLDICFESGQDDLSRKLIKRKLEAQRLRSFLSQKRKAVEDDFSGLTSRLEEDRTRLDSMRQKAELLAAEDARGQPEDSWSDLQFAVRDEDVEVAFLQEKQNRGQP